MINHEILGYSMFKQTQSLKGCGLKSSYERSPFSSDDGWTGKYLQNNASANYTGDVCI